MRAPDALKPDAEEKKGGGEYSIERLRELASAQRHSPRDPRNTWITTRRRTGGAARARANRSRSCPRHRALAATTISASTRGSHQGCKGQARSGPRRAHVHG